MAKNYKKENLNSNSVLENSQVIVDIKRLGINGEGIAYYKKLAVFVENALPGEGIDVKFVKVLPKMAYATPVKFMHESPYRIKPLCPYYKECGGCQTEHIEYKKMLEYKKDILIESLKRYTTLNPKSFEIRETFGMDDPWHYRYKSSLPIGKLDDMISVALINPKDNSLTFIDNCLTQCDIINRINKEVCEILTDEGIVPDDPYTLEGDVSHVVVRVSHYNKEAQVTLVTPKRHIDLRIVAEKILKIKNVVSVAFNHNSGEFGESIFGPYTRVLAGKNTITESIGKYKYELSPESFFQLNPVQTENLYEFAKKACKLSRKETVLDLYCGAGTIGIYIANMAKRVIGVEYNSQAIHNANLNAKINNVKNIEFYDGKVDELLPVLADHNIDIDILICDPPRMGMGEDVCNTILDNEFKRVVYISCNPATLAKDINVLSSKYAVKYIQPVDMFPQTSHVESVCLLELKKGNINNNIK